MLAYYDIRKDGRYRERTRVFKSFRSWVRDWLSGSDGGSVGPTVRPER